VLFKQVDAGSRVGPVANQVAQGPDLVESAALGGVFEHGLEGF
jgi:hypothetical protein